MLTGSKYENMEQKAMKYLGIKLMLRLKESKFFRRMDNST